MEIKEFQDKKAELEKTIEKLVNDFQQEVGVQVKVIVFQGYPTTLNPIQDLKCEIKAEI